MKRKIKTILLASGLLIAGFILTITALTLISDRFLLELEARKRFPNVKIQGIGKSQIKPELVDEIRHRLLTDVLLNDAIKRRPNLYELAQKELLKERPLVLSLKKQSAGEDQKFLVTKYSNCKIKIGESLKVNTKAELENLCSSEATALFSQLKELRLVGEFKFLENTNQSEIHNSIQTEWNSLIEQQMKEMAIIEHCEPSFAKLQRIIAILL